ncbi:MAG: hypothetical protein PHR47_00340 [Candidatus Pacebacteria bacterium]|nr:hypothetical protein [Candidatus Paceibacterota bacterium]
MQKKKIQFLYVITCTVLFSLVLLVVLLLQMQRKNIEQEKANSLLQEKIAAIERTNRTEPIFKQVEDVAPKEYLIEDLPLNKEYIGKWERVSITINGEQEKFSAATLEITEGTFTKTTNCVISGALSVSENKMIMSVERDDCKEGKNNFTSNYKVSSDKNSLILSISDAEYEVIEGYKRIFTPVPNEAVNPNNK